MHTTALSRLPAPPSQPEGLLGATVPTHVVQSPTTHVATDVGQGKRLQGRVVGGAAAARHRLGDTGTGTPLGSSAVHTGRLELEMPSVDESPGSDTHGEEQVVQSSAGRQ
jgi:hypothetical protein